jgi:aminopeptidase N
MEHALLNYCYLKLWVQDQPARLHYRLTNTTKGDQFRPVFLADPEIRIQQVTINGEPWQQFQPKEQVITLPEGEALRLTITLQ